MKDNDSLLQLQAYMDRELSERDARQVEERIATEPGLRALLAELKRADELFALSEEGVSVPETREFYWSSIQRAIQHEERRPAALKGMPLLEAWRRMLWPVGAAATLGLALFFAVQTARVPGVPYVEATVGDPRGFTYRDFATRTTLVWVSYPAENEFE